MRMISEIPRCIVKIQPQDNNGGRGHHPITAPKPRLFPMNSPQSHFHQQPPPSPPLPPPPPPPPGSETNSVPRHPAANLRSTTTTTVVNSRPHGNSSVEVSFNGRSNNDGHQRSLEKTPSPPIRRSISEKRDQEIAMKPEKLRQQVSSSADDNQPPQPPRSQVLLRKPGNLFLAQLYFFFHLALTICLLRANDSTKRSQKLYFHETILYYYSYLLGTSVLFIFLIRCCKSEYAYSSQKKPENTVVLLGSIGLGLIQLISIGLDFAQCVNKYFIYLPLLQFSFVFLLMHFVLTQARHGPQLGFSNIAVAHLLATQVSLWIINFDPNYGPCGYSAGSRYHLNGTVKALMEPVVEKRLFPFTDLLIPVIHHYQLLTVFILTTMWFMNNDIKRAAARGNTSGVNYDDSFAYSFFKKKASIKGFFLGLLIISASIIVLILHDSMLSLITHTAIQGISAIVAMIGLILRGKKLKTLYKSPITQSNANEHQLLIFVTILATYYCAFCMIISNLIIRNINITAILDGVVMIIHITFQTFLLRSGTRNKSGQMREVYAFLILANFSLWLLEVTQVAAKVTQLGSSDILLLPPLLMSLNRFYSALVFIQYWRSK